VAVRTLLAITLASLSWRRWSTLGLLLTAMTAFAAAAVGPLWANASEDSLLQRSLVDTKPSRMTLTLRTYGNDVTMGNTIPALAVRDVDLDSRMTPLLDRVFGPTRLALTTATRLSVTVPARGKKVPTRVLSTIAWVDGGCERLSMAVGRCPEGDSEVVLSERTARPVGAVVGRPVSLPQFEDEPEEAGSGDLFPTELRLVGVYRRPDTASPRLAETPVEAVATRRYVPSAPRGDVVDPVQDELARWDVAVAKLRGLRPRKVAVLGLLEPLPGRTRAASRCMAHRGSAWCCRATGWSRC
jgi:hypothetical protein